MNAMNLTVNLAMNLAVNLAMNITVIFGRKPPRSSNSAEASIP